MNDEPDEPCVMEDPKVKEAVLAYIVHGLYKPSFLLEAMERRREAE